jgi:hypothetical protein
VGPPQDASKRSGVQAPACRGGWRCCLLKGCGCRFKPTCARSQYCSPACQVAARRWQQWKAQRRYRSSDKGRAVRREQSRRRRARQREQRQMAANPPQAAGNHAAERTREGHQAHRLGKKCSCDRPGCYEGFDRSSRSPWQRFCSGLCRAALRLVRLRQRRWQDVCRGCPLSGLESCVTAVRGP